jgi:cobalt-zinc-cadmium efflux system membrane fusion protein
VTSPISGRITSVTANLGAFVPSETELFRVADPKRVQIEASVPGADAGRVAAGDRAVVETSAASAETMVRSVTPALNAETRSATVVMDAPPMEGLQSGAIVRVRILPKAVPTSTAIVVPDEAVQTMQGRDVVFLRTSQGFRAQAVTVGRRSAGRAEVVSGLNAGQAIATRNAFLLKAELGKGSEEDE